ncbi:MAG: hypothetical protein JKX84_09435 [Flavobacteriales bacterium]|nr:hypothetical protein [Flavobacteriales bacterium]
MKKTEPKQVIASYGITSLIIFVLSAFTSLLGVYGDGVVNSISTELMVLIQLIIVLLANFLLHAVFYFGGFTASPITKGLGIGTVLGLTYFAVSVFVLNIYNINTDSLQVLLQAMSGRVVEYSAGGVLTAVISVSDIGRWGLMRAF